MVPASRLRLTSHHIFTLVAVVFLVPANVEAQIGRVTMRGSINETVALSVLPNLTPGNVDADVMSSGNTVRISLSGADSIAPPIRVPLLVRSNSGFRISAVFDSETAELSRLSVMAVRATGTLVLPQAVTDVNVPQQFDLRGLDDESASATNFSSFEGARPFLLMSGPRVSVGGTFDSPNNALELTLLIRVKPKSGRGWSVDLTFLGTVESVSQ